MKFLVSQALLVLATVSHLLVMVQGAPREGFDAGARMLVDRADTANYVVYPKDPTNKDQVNAINDLLKSVVPDATQIYVADTDKGTFFWAAPLTDDNAKKVESNGNVGAIVKECTSNCGDPTGTDDQGATLSMGKRFDNKPTYEKKSHLRRRDDGYVNSHKIDPEMAFISLPARERLENYQDFVYDKSAGTGINVYIVDTGAGLSNDDEFQKFVVPNKRWLHARGAEGIDATEDDIKGVGHGTGVLAKACGYKHGAAKRANPIIIRMPVLGDPAAWLDGVRLAYNDWKPIYDKNPREKTAIMNLSWGWSRDALQKAGYDKSQQDLWIGDLRRLLNDCIGVGLLPVTPSGNANRMQPNNPPVDEYPQLFAYGLSPDVPNMMVVGGVTLDGNRWKGSKVDVDPNVQVIKVHAPSYDLHIPDAQSGGYRSPNVVEGTSYAAGTVTGLGAYFLGLSSLSQILVKDDPVQRVKELKLMLEEGTPLVRGNDKNVGSLSNTADPRTCPPDIPKDFHDGDEIECKDTSESSMNNVMDIPNCFITTPPPIQTNGVNIDKPAAECSCQGGVIAGIGSGTVSGTTYSWCQTGGLPKGVPPEATGKPAPPTVTASPQPTATTVPLSSQCVHIFTAKPQHTAICSTSVKKNDLSTPLPNGSWTCITGAFTECFCQAEGDAQPCEPADKLKKDKKRNAPDAGPMSTAAPELM